MRILNILLLLFVAAIGFGVETITTIPLAPQASQNPYNHVTQVAVSATEVGIAYTFAVTGYTSFVQMTCPVAWTYRGTAGSSTDSMPVAAGQTLTLCITGLGQTVYAVAGSGSTLYVIPLTYGRPGP